MARSLGEAGLCRLASTILRPCHDQQMASLMSIPVELVFEIVNLILDERLTLPAVGQDAAMVPPPNSRILWNAKPTFKRRVIQRIPWFPWRHSGRTMRKVEETALVRTAHCSLKALRATNRFFDEICQPFLYRELNLLSDLKLKQWKRTKHTLPLPRWSHIQSISVYMDPGVTYLDPADPTALAPFIDQSSTVAYILEKCRNVKSIALYYRDARVRTMHISFALLSLLKEGRLTALGFYSCRLLQTRIRYDQNTEEAEGVIDLLESIARYEPAQQSLLTLEVVADWIPVHIFDLIRSNFKALTSLTLRRVVRDLWFKPRMWDADQQSKWHPYPNLTHLHLDDFEPGHAAHFPSLVRHFKALDVLKISACGKDYIGQTTWRAPGWSQRANALCNTHRTLKSLYMAHMEGWEINELGVIPAATVIITTVKRDTLVELFSQDDEIFPGIRVLRLGPLPTVASAKDNAEGKPSIEDICNARNMKLSNDAPMMYWTCMCAFHYEA